MIKPNTILYLGAAALIIYLLVKFIRRNFEEYNYKSQINNKPLYKKISVEEQLSQKEERQKLIVEEHNNYYNKILAGKDFTNRKTTSLSQFVINSEINEFDLYKLAQLNGIKVEMGKGWYNLALELMVELDGIGWNRKVTSIKEKFGEMRFYAETHREDILDKYSDTSKTICEICGRPGKFFTANFWDFTRCDEHRDF